MMIRYLCSHEVDGCQGGMHVDIELECVARFMYG